MTGTTTTLETARLQLRPMLATDIDALLLIFTDPLVMASFGGGLFDQAQMADWTQRNLDHQVQHGYGLFAVISKATGELIGDCGLEHMQLDGEPYVELGYDFRSAYWNQGLATEAATAVRDYAFHELGLPRLICLIRTGNRASERVAARIGMRHAATFQHYDIQYNRYVLERTQVMPAPP